MGSMHTFSMPGSNNAIRKEIPRKYMPATKPPFFRYLRADTPEERALVVGAVVFKNEKKREECKSLSVSKRFETAQQDVHIGKIKFGASLLASSAVLYALMDLIPPLTPLVLAGQLSLLIYGAGCIVLNSDEMIDPLIDSIFGPDPKKRKDTQTRPDYWHNFRLDRIYDSANALVRERAAKLDKHIKRNTKQNA